MGKWRYIKDPLKTTPTKPGFWHQKVKDKAVELYLSNGSLAQTARDLNVPYETMLNWKQSDWWKDKVKALQSEEHDRLDVKLTKALDLALTNVADRIENGDVIIDPRTGQARRVDAKLRDLTTAFNTIMDKRQILRKQPTKIIEQATTATHLQNLADQFAQFVTGKIKKEKQIDYVDEIIEGETVELGEDGVYYVKDTTDTGETNAIHDQWKTRLQEGTELGEDQETESS
jgi:hypothetical protein